MSAVKRNKIIAIVLASLIIIGVGGLSVAQAFGMGAFDDLSTDDPKYKRYQIKAKLNGEGFDENKVNILIFGIDQNEERSETAKIFRPDTIMVANIDLEKKTMNLISIPRDCRVDIYNTSTRDKVNSSFLHAYNNMDQADKNDQDKVFKEGIKYLKYTVSDLLGGIDIDYYLGLDMDALPKLADVMGGVTINVHQDLYAKNGHDRSQIRIKKGKQVLNGRDLLYYSRYRAYDMGDIGRVGIQQKIILAIFEEFKRSGSFAKIPEIYNLVQDMITTDLEFPQIASLGYKFKDFSTKNLKTHTMPGMFGNLNSTSFWIINQAERVKFVKKLFGIDTDILTQDPTS